MRYLEILLIKPDIQSLFDDLELDYKILLYYLRKAAVPINEVYSHQIHRYAPEILKCFEFLDKHVNPVLDADLKKEIKIFLVYLQTNHSQYFIREAMTKKTPSLLGMTELTPEKFDTIMKLYKYPHKYEHLIPHIFTDIESTLVVEGSIEKSNVGHYHPQFKQKYYNDLETGLNKYYDVVDKVHVSRVYSIKDKCDKQMKEAHKWILEALEFAKKSKIIPQSIQKTLLSLSIFLATGSEDDLRRLSIDWSNMDEKIDFLFGPFEVYNDPMHVSGSYAVELTVRNLDLEKFRKIWPRLERMLPYPSEHMRTIPEPGNISIRTKLYSGGSNGPLRVVAAYCLPNDDELRQKKAKQVIYKYDHPRGGREYCEIKYINHTFDILKKYDENFQLPEQIWSISVLLHETLGHAAGKINVDVKQLPKLIGDDFSSLEELRADINAAWISIVGYDDLKECFDWWKKWDSKLGKLLFQELILTELLNCAFSRVVNLPDNFDQIEGAHVRANIVITNFILSRGGVEIVKDYYTADEKIFLKIGFKITDLSLVIESVKMLCTKVQSIKSAGDGKENTKLFKWYMNNPISLSDFQSYSSALKIKQNYLFEGAKISADVYPEFIPIIEDGKIKNIVLKWL